MYQVFISLEMVLNLNTNLSNTYKQDLTPINIQKYFMEFIYMNQGWFVLQFTCISSIQKEQNENSNYVKRVV